MQLMIDALKEETAWPGTDQARFASGRRRPYDPACRTLPRAARPACLPHVFIRVHGDPSPDGHRINLLPDFPDGSYALAGADSRLRGGPSRRLTRAA
jgi:hypothetical protein